MKIIDFLILVDTKARMSLKAEASRLYFSFLWWIIEPLLFVITFYFVFSVLLQNPREDYLLFLLCAKIPYMWFSKAVTTASSSIIANSGIISQIDMPKAIFPYAAIQVSLYKEIPVYLLMIGMCAYYGYFPRTEWLWLIPLTLALYLLIVSVSLIFAFLVCYADDMRMLIKMMMLFLMFISGIFFDISSIHQPLRDYLLIFNPLAFICDGYRKVLMNNGLYDLTHLTYLLLFLLLTTAVIHVVYSKMSRTIASRVVNA